MKESPTINRRLFLQSATAAGALAMIGGGAGCAPKGKAADSEVPAELPSTSPGRPAEATIDPKTGDVTINPDILVRYSACLGCYCCCGKRIKVDRESGKILGIGGNPYHPACSPNYLPFDAPLEDAYRTLSYANGQGAITHGTICARGNGTLDACSQPDRITVPLKRAGERGSGKWRPISWDELISEIVNGGKLFSDLGEDVDIQGFKALHDVTTPLDPEKPSLGPISNQVVFLGGRADGRGGPNGRFTKAYGTINKIGHFSSCGLAGGFSEFYSTGVDTFPDIDETEYIIWSGCYPGANGGSMQFLGSHTARRLKTGELKIDIFDPTLANGVATATMPGINWIPIKPATNAALYTALAQIITRDKTYDADAMAFTNQKAAQAAGYGSYTNAPYLVICDDKHPNNKLLMRAADAGITETSDEELFVVVDPSTGSAATQNTCDKGVLEFEGDINGVHVKTAFSLFLESINSQTLNELSDITGVTIDDFERVAKEYVSHGYKACVYSKYGSTGNAVGFDTSFGREALKALIGCNQRTGGSWPIAFSVDVDGEGPRYNLQAIEGAPDVSAKNATAIHRCGKKWEDTDEYANRIAGGEKNPQPLLPWYENAINSDCQTIMSIVNQYPYQAKILVTWMNNVIMACPGAQRDEVIERLKDTSVVPLHIACDIVMGDTTQYADYIVPDYTQYEAFGFPLHLYDTAGGCGTAMRWPASAPEAQLLDDKRHMCYENFLIDVALACDLPGFGSDAIHDMDGGKHPFFDGADYFIKAAANLAYYDTPVEDITDDEVQIQGLDQLDSRWKEAVTEEEWKKVLKVMSRGGRFWSVDETRGDDGLYKDLIPKQTFIYHEGRLLTKNNYGDKHFAPTLKYNQQVFADLSPMVEHFDASEYPFVCSEYKPKFRSISMLANSPIMRDICAHNYIELNEQDAKELGISDGDMVRAITPTGDITEGQAWVRAGQARGAFAAAYGYGHLNYGAKGTEIDSQVTEGTPEIADGVHILMMLDPILTKEKALGIISDNYAGSPARCGGMFKIEKI